MILREWSLGPAIHIQIYPHSHISAINLTHSSQSHYNTYTYISTLYRNLLLKLFSGQMWQCGIYGIIDLPSPPQDD